MNAPAERAALLRDISLAAKVIAPLWPVERFVAVNPLVGLLDDGFVAAMEEARTSLGLRGFPGLDRAERRPGALEARRGREAADAADALVEGWVARLVAGAERPAPGAAFASWRALAAGDHSLRRLVGRPARATLTELPGEADDALLAVLRDLEVPPGDRVGELRSQLARSPGWSGYAVWCDAWAAADDPSPRITVLDLLTIRVVTDALVMAAWSPGTRRTPTSPPPSVDALGRLDAAEDAYRTDLVGRLRTRPPRERAEPIAQVVCCIDARSEGLRRHLEALGPYETLGFAGFFGVAARVRPLAAAEAYASAPVLLSPTLELVETPAGDPLPVAPLAARRGIVDATRVASHGPAAFGWAEASGWVYGLLGAARTAHPRLTPTPTAPATRIDVSALTTPEQAGLVETALVTMGLTRSLAPLVVLCGHGATTTANPHGAALDCGACAGNRGGANARALATMANDPAVRAILSERGLAIPEPTLFLAAEHDTTTDAVVLLDLDAVPPHRRSAVDALVGALERAGAALTLERADDLRPTARRSAARSAQRRSLDWSEVRPEWGLARNAAFVVAPRASTAGADLQRRAFLHSYDADADATGSALETILTAPMVVAHWINMQYYCSTVDPEVLGAGDKAVHNPLGGIGVLSGGSGDLRVGLPWQSVGRGDAPYHEPLRLLTVIEAPASRVEAVIARNPILRQLFDGAWVHLVVREPGRDEWSRRLPGGDLIPIPLQETPCPSPA